MANRPRRKPAPLTIARMIVLSVVMIAAVASAIFGLGVGNLSSFGFGAVAYLCPLGALEGMFGSWAFVPRVLIALAAALILAFLVGRAFCAWACPVPPLQKFLNTKKAAKQEESERLEAAAESNEHYVEGTKPQRGKIDVDSRHIVLCGALGSAAIFGFPVFCLVCPIGLTFAIVVGLVRLVGFNEPSFSLLIFAGILVLELVVLRKWCAKICPVGALLSLLGKLNRTFRPTADATKCLRTTEGAVCGACAAACPEMIDPQSDLGVRAVSDCTRCGKCADACPSSALSFPLMAKRKPVIPAESPDDSDE